jgi:hypothetical protein
VSLGTAYGLGVLSPFAVLAVWAMWNWATEEAGLWWRRQQPTLGRLRCTLAGHRYVIDHSWVVCSRCSHAKRNPADRDLRLDLDQ